MSFPCDGSCPREKRRAPTNSVRWTQFSWCAGAINRAGVPVLGTMLVATTIGTEQNCRVRLESGEIITAKPSELVGSEAEKIG